MMRTFGVLVMAMSVAGVGCAMVTPVPPSSRWDAYALWGDSARVRLEFADRIDRVTYFGPIDGPNLLHIQGERQDPKPDGSYTFFGGAYTWVAPQNAWLGDSGSPQPWPPDPAMDVGPAPGPRPRLPHREAVNPANRLGLVERKRFKFRDEYTIDLAFRLENVGNDSRLCGAWINTALSNDHKLAVRAPFGTEVWAWEGKDSKPLTDLMSQPNENGWVLIDLSRANWEGGIKFYIQPGAVNGETTVDIAQWFGGYWMYRRQKDCGAGDFALLKENGEGPVAVYIQPGAEPIIEAELYGRLVNLAPGRSERWTEEWRVIEAATPDVSVLP